MDKLEDALARLEQAVARLEAASGVSGRSGETSNPQLTAIVEQIAVRVDDALARISRVLGAGD
ncbi:MAG TPA: hypothetical protein VKG22_07265 [Stellaceae bacterium]|nr:hypothetical protein [Stellaceae bacterium]HMD66431.1 hypothetical protein [Stellaceae bacterium]